MFTLKILKELVKDRRERILKVYKATAIFPEYENMTEY
jgi:hypothetical protein